MNRSKLLRKTLSYDKLLLDQYSGAVGAYSLRYLSSDFKGNDVVVVRRSSDDSEQGFTPVEISDGTLTSFTGAGDGYITTWYDQSGVGNHKVNSNTSNQPRIVSAGSVVTENGNPAVDFNTGFLKVVLSSSIDTTNVSVVTLQSVDAGSTDNGHTSISNGNVNDSVSLRSRVRVGNYELNFRVYNGSFVKELRYSATEIDDGLQHITAGVAGSDVYLRLDGQSVDSATNATPTSYDNSFIGILGDGSTWPFDGKMQEVLIIEDNDVSKVAGIEMNINSYYNVF